MHEMAIAANLVEHVVEVAQRNRARLVEEVEVEVGVLQQVVPEALTLAFTVAAAGTVAEGARLKLTEVKAVAECRGCGQRFEATIDNYLCQACQRADVRIVAGNDIVLKSVVCQIDDGVPSP